MQDNTFENGECVCSKIDDVCLSLEPERNDTSFPYVVPSNVVTESFLNSQCSCCKCLKCPISVIKRLCQLAMKDDERQYFANERYSVFEGGLSMSMDKKPQLDGRGDFAYIKKSKKLDYSSDEHKPKAQRSSSKGKSKQVKRSNTDSDVKQEDRKRRRRRAKLDNKQQHNSTKPKSRSVSKIKKHGSTQRSFLDSSSSSNMALKTNRMSAKQRKRVGKSKSELDAGKITGAESQKFMKDSRKASGKEPVLDDSAQTRTRRRRRNKKQSDGENASSKEVLRKLKKKKQHLGEHKSSTLTAQIGAEVLREVVQLDKLTKSKIRKMKNALNSESFRWTISEIDENTNDGNGEEVSRTKKSPLWIDLKKTKQEPKLDQANRKVEYKGGRKSGEWPRTNRFGSKVEIKQTQPDIIKNKKKTENVRTWPVIEPRIGMVKQINPEKRVSRGFYGEIVSNDMIGRRAEKKSNDALAKKLSILSRLAPDFLRWQRRQEPTDYEKNRHKHLSEKQKLKIRNLDDAYVDCKKGRIRRSKKSKHETSARVELTGIDDFMRVKLEAGDINRLRTISARTVKNNPSGEYQLSAPNHGSELGDVSNPYPAAINPLSYCYM